MKNVYKKILYFWHISDIFFRKLFLSLTTLSSYFHSHANVNSNAITTKGDCELRFKDYLNAYHKKKYKVNLAIKAYNYNMFYKFIPVLTNKEIQIADSYDKS